MGFERQRVNGSEYDYERDDDRVAFDRAAPSPGKRTLTRHLSRGLATRDLANMFARSIQLRRAPQASRSQSPTITHEVRVNTVELQVDENAAPADVQLAFDTANAVYNPVGLRVVRGTHQVVRGRNAGNLLRTEECREADERQRYAESGLPGDPDAQQRAQHRAEQGCVDGDGLDVEEGYQMEPRDHSAPPQASAEVLEIMRQHGTPGELTGYFVPRHNVPGRDGQAVDESYYDNLQGLEGFFVTAGAGLDTFAHELGHVLMGIGHTDLDGSDDNGNGVADEQVVDTSDDNLMQDGDHRTGVNLTPRQVRALLNSRYVHEVGAPSGERRSDPVQRQLNGSTPALGADRIHELAQMGLAGAGDRLPHYDQIQAAFGHHDVGNIRVSSGEAARTATAAMGATAYASGDSIALGEGTDMFTVAHEAAHVIQQRAGVSLSGGVGQEGDAYERQADDVAARVVRGESVEAMLDMVLGNSTGDGEGVQMDRRQNRLSSRPEDCPTFEMWMASFRHLPDFASRDGQRVLGDEPAGPGEQPRPAEGDPRMGEERIDHPSRDWIRQNLPPDLQATAYQLPADCADTALILRHVWLVAHGRTETHRLPGRARPLRIGAGIGNSPEQRRDRLAPALAGGAQRTDRVSSGSFEHLVQPYAGRDGQPLRSRQQLLPMLHPGDMLVWRHHVGSRELGQGRPNGGHVQTIQSIDHASGRISVIQGNQPLSAAEGEEVIAETPNGEARARREGHPRYAPGRRLERSMAPNPNSASASDTIWGYQHSGPHGEDANTVLVVAGPPRSAGARPRQQGQQRSLGDWVPRVNAATAGTIEGVVEAALTEARSYIEGGSDAVSAHELEQLGNAIGTRAAALQQAGANQLVSRLRVVIFALSGRATDGGRLRALRTRSQHEGGLNARNTAGPRAGAVARQFDGLISAFDRSSAGERGRGDGRVQQRRAVQRDPGSSAAGVARQIRQLEAAADLASLEQTFAAVVGSMGPNTSEADARAIGRAAGQQLWQLAAAAARGGDLGRDGHFEPLHRLRASARQATANARALEDELNLAGRGAADLGQRAGGDHRPRILLTGFDPFRSGGAPTDGMWNPSGAAVLAMDGQTSPGGAAIEGVVYPVSFAEFGTTANQDGIVERVVRPRARDFDAIITVSMNMTTPVQQPARVIEIERFAVGVHHTGPMQTHSSLPPEQHPRVLAPIPSGSDGERGDDIIESNAPVDEVARDAGIVVDSHLDLWFDDAASATRAADAIERQFSTRPTIEQSVIVRVLGQDATTHISDHHQQDGDHISFVAGGTPLRARIAGGPGGNFLSNEVSYRTQRTLQHEHPASADRPQSFHVHTMTAPSSAQNRAAAQAARDQVIAALWRVVDSVAGHLTTTSGPGGTDGDANPH